MARDKTRLLLVDDDEDDFVITRDVIAAVPGSFDLTWRSSFDAGFAACRAGVYDILLLDYRLGEHTGIDFLKRLRESGSDIPVIFLTGEGDRDIDLLAMRAGATDFLAKAELQPVLLDRAIRYALAMSDLNRQLVDEHERLLRAEKLSSIGLLAASVAHEVNNPLGGVMNLVQSLREGGLSDEKRLEYLSVIEEGLQRMRATVQSLLDFARVRPPEIAAVDVGGMLAPLLILISGVFRKKALTVDNRIAPGRVSVRGDRSQLMQALTNLLLNAAHASPTQGTIGISAFERADQIGIAVSDAGSGIPKEIAERVFEPFFTTKAPGEGTGLGLPTVRSIMRAHGGELSLESRPTGGTLATLWLRRAAALTQS